MRWVSVMTLMCATIGCVVGPAAPAETVFNASSPDAFAGEWRSVTPSLEFIGLNAWHVHGILKAISPTDAVPQQNGGRQAEPQ